MTDASLVNHISISAEVLLQASNNILDKALDYAAAGWFVFPSPGTGEKKGIKSKKYSSEGKRWGATKTPDTLRGYWAEHPDANVGIPTGIGNRVWALDVDTTEGHDADGFASLAALVAEHGPLPPTLESESPSGSVHYWFKYPADMEIRNSESVLAPGLDVRGEGGMVLAPPSVKPGKGCYKWRNDLPIADAPEWLNQRARDALQKSKTKRESGTEHTPVALPPPPPGATRVEKALHDDYYKVALAPVGTRNSQLNKSSFALGRFVGAGELDEQKAIQTMVDASKANGSYDEDEDECAETIDSGMEAGKASPVATVHTMFGEAVAARNVPPPPGSTGEVIAHVNSADAPLAPIGPPQSEHKPVEGARGPQTEDEMEPVEYDPPAGYMQSLGDRLKNFVLPDYLWDEILMKRFCYSMTAQTGTGKTAIALLLAAHVATGRSLCGLDVEKGQVIYLAGENPVDVDMRWFGLCQVMGLDPDALEVAILPFAGPLSKYADAIREECETRSVRPALVIVDTAAAYFEGKEGNSNEEQGDYARSLRALTTLPGQPCILVLAHPTKVAKDINEMIPRGGSAFLNEVDGNIGVARGDGGLIAAAAIGKLLRRG